MAQLRVVVIGVGALGCLLGAHLSAAPEGARPALTLLGRWPEQLAAIRAGGLWLEHPDGRRTHHPLAVAADPAEAGPADVALVAVKSRQTDAAAACAAALLDAGGLALTLQNGLNNQAALRRALGEKRVALGMTAQGATVLGPGVVRHAGHGPTHIGRDPALGPVQQARLPQLAALFNAAGLETHLVDNTDGLVWGKLAVNAAINPLTALLRVPNGFLAEHEALVELMGRAAREVAAVAAAQGIALPFDDPAERALIVARATAANHSSMLQDVSRGAPTEIEAICGAVVRAGRAAGVPTPVNDALCRLVRRLEEGRAAPLVAGDVAGVVGEIRNQELGIRTRIRRILRIESNL
jgi:2-dehydropantoate 2-reductase